MALVAVTDHVFPDLDQERVDPLGRADSHLVAPALENCSDREVCRDHC